MKPLKLLLLLCLVSCLESWSQTVYYVTVKGAGDHSGSTWANALDAYEFSNLFNNSPSGTTFRMEGGVYRPGEGMSGFSTDKAFVLEGGYKNVEGEMVRDLSTMTDDDMTVLLGDISNEPKENKPISFIPESDGMDVSGVIFESSALGDFFVLNSTYSGGEIVMRKGVGRRPQNKPCEGSADEIYTETIVVGGMSNFGDGDVDITRDKIGTFSIVKEKVGEDGCASTYTYIVNVLPKPTKIDGKPHYYVKLGGKGDGSSWEKAMGDTAFAYSISKVEDGATFHIAEGVYHPIYDMNGALTTVNQNRMYYTNKAINLQGGYPADPSGDVKAQPDQFIAVLSGDLTNNKYVIDSAGKGSRDVHNILYFDLPDGGDIRLSGLAMKGTGSAFIFGTMSQTGVPSLVGVNSLGEKATLTMEDCQLVNSNDGLRAKNCDVSLENCYFYDNFMGSSVTGDYLSVKKSSFEESYMDVSAEKCQVENSSYISKTVYTLYGLNIKKSGTTSLENNTFVTGVDISGCSSIAMTGNIFVDTIRKESDLATLTSSHNVYKKSVSFSSFMSDNDIILPSQEDFHKFLRTETKKVDGKDTVVFARETYRKGIPVIPMDEDHYGSVSLRFPLKEVAMKEDQMGNPRPDSTCVGAFEKGFPRVTITLDDVTAIAGETFTDKQMGIDTVFTKIGSHLVEKRLEHGSLFVHDTIYIRHISVLPKSTKDGDGKFHYYVKLGGKGDGSSWEKAMGDTAFAYSINRVEDGATFHIAEGVYRPIYDKNGEETTSYGNRTFYTTKLINLDGGYSKEATGKAVANPKANKTVLSGCMPGSVDEEFDDGSYYVHNILLYNLSNPGKVCVNGLTFQGSWMNMSGEYADGNLAIYAQTQHVEFEVNECSFSKGYTFIRANNCSGRVKDCYFYNPSLQAVYSESGSVYIERSTFDRGKINIINVTGLDSLGIINCTFRGDVLDGKSNFSLQYEIKDLRMINNTIMMPVSIGESVQNAEIIGNIFGDGLILEAARKTTSGNVYLSKEGTYGGFTATDKSVTKADLMSILDNDGNEFLLSDNCGYTPVIGLLSDTLKESGASIRFSRRGITNEDEDQCGNPRYDSTCAGSVEKDLTTIIVLPLSDTIVYAGKYTDARVGVDTSLSIGTCSLKRKYADTVYTREVIVLPRWEDGKDGKHHYYVKNGGKGDGSSWDNAMGDTAFAFSFDRVEGGSTFHIAEGIYRPVYDKRGVPTTVNSEKIFYTNAAINLQGGYPAGASGVVEANPAQYLAVLSGDLKSSNYAIESGSKDVSNVLYYDLKNGGDIRLSGLAFKGSSSELGSSSQSMDPSLVGVISHGASANLTMSDCQLVYSDYGLSTENCDVDVENCYFYDNQKGSVVKDGVLSISQTSFEKSFVDVNAQKCQVRNCTYISKTGHSVAGLLIGTSKKVESIQLENNTFLTSVVAGDFANLTMTGNIFADTVRSTGKGSVINSSYNIYSNEGAPSFKTDIDIAFPALDFKNFLRGHITNEGNGVILAFDRESYRHGIPVIPMDTDCVGGVLLRFPRTLVSMGVDQRDKKRPENTCIGAYETRTVSETQFNPMVERDRYYVKMEASGLADGSSWENAIDNKSFQRSLLMSKKANVVYYIAQGEYEPIYDSTGYVPEEGDEQNLLFYVNRPVTLIGGFPSNAKSDDTIPDPSVYPTLFWSGNRAVHNLLLFDLKDAGVVSISGINFNGGSFNKDAGAVVVNAHVPGVELVMNRCNISDSYKGLVLNSCSSVIKNSSFMEDSIGILLNAESACSLEINSSTLGKGAKGLVTSGAPGNIKVLNSTFVDFEESAIDLSSTGSLSCELLNNTILGDAYIPYKGKNDWIGNIFAGIIRRGDNASGEGVSSYNLYLKDDGGLNEQSMKVKADETTDLWATSGELSLVLESAGNGSYVLKDNGGFTQTVAVVSDVLSESQSIRFPKKNTVCDKDQRGLERFSLTCRGAFELDQNIYLSIPSAFTPYTQDGVNDKFMPGLEVYIYDRYGMLICHSMDGWDGYYRGSLATPGVYAYVLIIQGSENRKGTIEILKTK